LIATHNHNNCN